GVEARHIRRTSGSARRTGEGHMAQRKAKRGAKKKATSSRPRKGASASRKTRRPAKRASRSGAPAASRRLAELEAENRRLRSELEVARAELANRAQSAPNAFPGEPTPSSNF